MDGAVARIVIALLGIKSELEVAFDGRNLKNFSALSGHTAFKDLCGVLAFWLNEQEIMNRHVKVIGSNQAKLTELHISSTVKGLSDRISRELQSPVPSVDSLQKTDFIGKRSYTYRRTKFSQMVDVESSNGLQKKLIHTFTLMEESKKQPFVRAISRIAPFSSTKKPSEFILVPQKLADDSQESLHKEWSYEAGIIAFLKCKAAFVGATQKEQEEILRYLTKLMMQRNANS